MNETQKKLIEEWRDDCRMLLRAYYDCASRFEQRNLYLAVPAVVLSATVGTSVFAALNSNPTTTAKIAVGCTSIAVSVLTALQAFLRYSERSEKHRMTGSAFAALRKKIEHLLACPPTDQEAVSASMTKIEEEWNTLRREAIALSSHQIASYTREIHSRHHKDEQGA